MHEDTITMAERSSGKVLPHSFPFSWRRVSGVWGCIGWGLVICLALTALRAGAAVIDGYISSRNGVIGFTADPSVYTNFFFGWLLLTYYLWLPQGIASLLDGLRINDVLKAPLAEVGSRRSAKGSAHRGRAPVPSSSPIVGDWVAVVLTRYDRPWMFWLGLGAGGVVAVAMGFHYRAMEHGVWYTAGRVSVVAAQVWVGVLLTCLFTILIACGSMIVCLRGLFRGGTNVRPLHPDGVGGLAPMADFTLSLVYLISAVGIMLLAITPFTRGLASGKGFAYTFSPDIVIAAVVYGLASPLVFFRVLATASGAMREAKRVELAKIAARWDVEYPATLQAVASESADFSPMVSRLKVLRELYQATRSFPVWPFDQASMRKFLGSYFSPLIGIVIDKVVKQLLAR
jgi:hypothetical protein